jgi:hypothetical protein
MVTLSVGGQAVNHVAVTGRKPEIDAPVDLARKAVATASSSLYPTTQPAMVNDGNPNTHWCGNSTPYDGWWVELTWPQPIWFNQVSFGEHPNVAGYIKSWKLLAGNEELTEIASGSGVGAFRIVTLGKPVQASKIRLQIDPCGTPTIDDIIVEDIRPGR